MTQYVAKKRENKKDVSRILYNGSVNGVSISRDTVNLRKGSNEAHDRKTIQNSA